MRSFWLSIVVMTFIVRVTTAQICDGNLGENIFPDGDFGRGIANVLLPDPLLAPGYQYQPAPPPNDGYYTITNNTSSWGSFAFTHWINIEDNSPDPQGYMMVVNASYATGEFYRSEVTELCENTLYVFSADIINLNKPGVNGIRPNVSFLLDEQIKYTTGSIPENGSWNTYGFTFTTEPGQTELTLSLRNNAVGGLGNDLALDNISFRACGPQAFILPETIANICEDGNPIDLEATFIGDQYDTPELQWQRSFDEGQSWVDIPGANTLTYKHTELSGGFYYYRFTLANGPVNLLNRKCRVVSNPKIVHVIPKYYTIIDTLCDGLAFALGDKYIDSTGIYTDSLLSVFGCDSIVTLQLTVVPDDGIDLAFELQHPSCHDSRDGSIRIENMESAAGPYSIRVDQLFNADGHISNQSAGSHHYQITDRFGCRLDTLLELISPAPFTFSLGADRVIELGETVGIEPVFSEPAAAFFWTSEAFWDGTIFGPTIQFIPLNSGWVSLSAWSEAKNCLATDSLWVDVRTSRKIFLPNAFSPNFDGYNDRFTLYGSIPNVQSIEQLVIYDRWGNLVFETRDFQPNDPAAGWDGNWNGMAAQPGVYVFLAKVRFLDGVVLNYSGDISLLR